MRYPNNQDGEIPEEQWANILHESEAYLEEAAAASAAQAEEEIMKMNDEDKTKPPSLPELEYKEYANYRSNKT